VFLKEISSNGNLNTVDVMFQSWPIFVSLNPDYIRMFLQPMMSYLELPKSKGWPKPWTIHDMGTCKFGVSGIIERIANSPNSIPKRYWA
jgi:hypothetical protein